MPHDLLQALQARGMSPRVVSHPYEAMAGVLSCQLMCQLRSEREGVDQPVVLVAVQPDRLERIDQLFACLDRFAPRVARWSYDASARPPLQAAQLRPKPVVVQPDSKEAGAGVPEGSATSPQHDTGQHRSGAGGQQSEAVSPSTVWNRTQFSGPMLRLAGLGSELKPLRSEEDEAASILTREEMAALLSDEPGGAGGSDGRGGSGGHGGGVRGL